MTSDAQRLLNSPKQRFARFLHLLKARHRRKEKDRVVRLGEFIEPNAMVIDVGAHFGYFAKEFAVLHEHRCDVVCFEPFTYNRAILRSVMRAFENAQIVPLGLADSAAQIPIHIPSNVAARLARAWRIWARRPNASLSPRSSTRSASTTGSPKTGPTRVLASSNAISKGLSC